MIVRTVLRRSACLLAAVVVASTAAVAQAAGSFIQFTLEGPQLKKRVVTLDLQPEQLRNINILQLQGLTSREGHKVPTLGMILGNGLDDTRGLLALGAEEDTSTGRGSMAMTTTSKDGVATAIRFQPKVDEKDRKTGSFSGVLVVTNRKDRTPEQRTYQLTDGRYDLTRAPRDKRAP